MIMTMLKGKIHRATVVQAELDYVGSITIDEALMEASGICEYEQVQIVDINNGDLCHCRRAKQRNDLPERCGCPDGAGRR